MMIHVYLGPLEKKLCNKQPCDVNLFLSSVFFILVILILILVTALVRSTVTEQLLCSNNGCSYSYSHYYVL